MPADREPRTPLDLIAMKGAGRKIAVLTCYDAAFARLLAPEVDLLLVGDSVNQVVAGRETTLTATLEQLIYHAAAVRRDHGPTLGSVLLRELEPEPGVRARDQYRFGADDRRCRGQRQRDDQPHESSSRRSWVHARTLNAECGHRTTALGAANTCSAVWGPSASTSSRVAGAPAAAA